MTKEEMTKSCDKISKEISKLRKQIDKIKGEYVKTNSIYVRGDVVEIPFCGKYEVIDSYLFADRIYYNAVRLNNKGKKMRYSINNDPYLIFFVNEGVICVR